MTRKESEIDTNPLGGSYDKLPRTRDGQIIRDPNTNSKRDPVYMLNGNRVGGLNAHLYSSPTDDGNSRGEKR